MLNDLELAKLCQSQYDGEAIFDHVLLQGPDCCSIKYYKDCTAVVHEGSHNIPNWIDNFEAIMEDVPDFAGVEEGFYEWLPQVTELALPLIPKGKPVYVTGHSRGAARALIFAAILLKQGYNVVAVTFGSPRPGNVTLAAILAGCPVRSYRNFGSFDEQDFVCDVPLPLGGYVHPGRVIKVNSPPPDDDPWLLLAWHHLSLYIKALENG